MYVQDSLLYGIISNMLMQRTAIAMVTMELSAGLLLRPFHQRRPMRNHAYRKSVGDELDVVEGDKVTKTNAEENKYRRTIVLEKQDGQSWGFTIQSYGIHHKKEDEVELLTYVDYVAHNSPAFYAGMRAGDVILSIDGTNMEEADHVSLIEFIKNCNNIMRMVVLFEDCCKKVELHLRHIKLKRVLAEKVFELRSLEQQEMRVLSGLSRFDSCRSSRASSNSSNSMWDDRLSLVPELDRCPTPDRHPLYHQSDSSISPSPSAASPFFPSLGPRFDFDRSSLPVRSHRPPSLAASASINAALNASFRNSTESLTSPLGSAHGRLSPRFNFDASPIYEHSIDDSLTEYNKSHRYSKLNGHCLTTSTPEHSLIKPGRSLSHSGRHASAPDSSKLFLQPKPLPRHKPHPEHGGEEVELDMFRLRLVGADFGESSTESPSSTLTRPSKHKSYPPHNGHLSSHLSSSSSKLLDQRDSDERNLEKLSASFQSAFSLTSSGGSSQFNNESSTDSIRDASPESDPDISFQMEASSTDSEFSFSEPASPDVPSRQLPTIQIEFINDEDAVSQL